MRYSPRVRADALLFLCVALVLTPIEGYGLDAGCVAALGEEFQPLTHTACGTAAVEGSASEIALDGDGPTADAAEVPGRPRDTAPVVTPPPPPETHPQFYVATDGSDDNPGSQSAPFKTIAHAARRATPDTTVFVAPGTYEGGFKTTSSGTATGRIAYRSTKRWGARIIPPARSRSHTAWDNRGNFVDIVGFEVDGTDSREGTKWTHGIYNGGSFDSVRDNHVHHIATSVPCTSAGGSAIGVDSYYHGVSSDVIGNVVHDIGPPGCRFVQGIYVSTSGTVKNNVVYRVSGAAIHLWHDATNVIITNNTVSASDFGIIVGGGNFYHTSGPNDHTVVSNNIVYDNRYGVSEQGKTGKHNTYQNNLLFRNTAYDWQLRNGLTPIATVGADPKFVNYTRTGVSDFHLDSNSPAIGGGTATDAPLLDIEGKPRTPATGYDIGAYQHGAAPGDTVSDR
ncbi:DUF1565 domain-containing protein [Singulisphaera sp. Ch08]|uniref:DUF1565 domain-containing protein n=1 Tax=Singulisphaera sp. Ch08 TaxID=3120278 RepID=A0AAU7CKE4_9BACT